jgi:hypothetical protein
MANRITVSTATSAFYIMNRLSDEKGMLDGHLGKVECRGQSLKLKSQHHGTLSPDFFEPQI